MLLKEIAAGVAEFAAFLAVLEILFFLIRDGDEGGDGAGVIVVIEGYLGDEGCVDEAMFAGFYVFVIAVDADFHGGAAGVGHATAQDDDGAEVGAFAEDEVVYGGGDDFHAAVAGGDDAGEEIDPGGELAAEEFAVAVEVLGHDDADLFGVGF